MVAKNNCDIQGLAAEGAYHGRGARRQHRGQEKEEEFTSSLLRFQQRL